MDKRKARFKRVAKKPIELTQRDCAILLALHKYRFLTSDHIMTLTYTQSRWSMNKRLRQLYDHKSIDRPAAQRALFSHASKRPTVYALGHEGASLLSTRFGIVMPPSVYWTEKNRRVREHYIEHTLGISDFMIEIETLCGNNPDLRLIDRAEILAASPDEIQRARYPFRWQTAMRHLGERHSFAIAPDYIFGIERRSQEGETIKRYYFAEIDRGTMPVTRRDIRQSSIMRKLRSYADSYERGLAERRFEISGFQVLFITTSQKRIEAMQAAIANSDDLNVPAGLFLFRTKADAQASLPFHQSWTNAKGKPASMI